MTKLMICSEPDLPSVNMRAVLTGQGGWKDAGSAEGCTLLSKGEDFILSTPNLHIFADGLDGTARSLGISPDTVIFMSKHSSATGEPALTVHPIGNFRENRFGGRARTLVKAAPAMMTDALRKISAYSDLPEFRVCFEVTHHGPWTDAPTFFIEIGSDERNWGNPRAAEILAHVISDASPEDYPVAVGIGGGHYAPRFTEVALAWKINFGHMIPGYQLDGADDVEILRMVKDSFEASSADCVYVHRNTFKKPEERRIRELLDSEGYEVMSSSDLEPLSGN